MTCIESIEEPICRIINKFLVAVSQLRSAIYQLLIPFILVKSWPLLYKLVHNMLKNGLKMLLLARMTQEGPMSLVPLIQQAQSLTGIARVAGDACSKLHSFNHFSLECLHIVPLLVIQVLTNQLVDIWLEGRSSSLDTRFVPLLLFFAHGQIINEVDHFFAVSRSEDTFALFLKRGLQLLQHCVNRRIVIEYHRLDYQLAQKPLHLLKNYMVHEPGFP